MRALDVKRCISGTWQCCSRFEWISNLDLTVVFLSKFRMTHQSHSGLWKIRGEGHTCTHHSVDVVLFYRGDPAGPHSPLVVSRWAASGLHDHQWHAGAKDGSSFFHRNALPCQLGVSLPKGKSPAAVSHLSKGAISHIFIKTVSNDNVLLIVKNLQRIIH